MHIPKIFEECRKSRLIDFMARNPLASIVYQSGDGLGAEHIPLQFVNEGDHGVLHGHASRRSQLVDPAMGSASVLAIFNGPDAYISPSWYPSRQEHGRVQPSWFYAVVHVHGTLQTVPEPDWLVAHLKRLTDQHEAHQEQPWSMSEAPTEFTRMLLAHTIGFELRIERIVGKWQVGQQRSSADRQGIVDALLAKASCHSHDLVDFTTSTWPRGADRGARQHPARWWRPGGGFRLAEPQNTVAGRGYPVAACRSWKIRRSIL